MLITPSSQRVNFIVKGDFEDPKLQKLTILYNIPQGKSTEFHFSLMCTSLLGMAYVVAFELFLANSVPGR